MNPGCIITNEKSKTCQEACMPEYFDMHCHLLFGVDDGPACITEALTLLQQEYDDGVRTIYLTPHYRRNMFECPNEVRVQNFELLKTHAKQHFPELNLKLGCEIHVSMDLVQDLKSGNCSPLEGTDFILLEFQEAAEKKYIIERCHAAMTGGYSPIIAHAERCIAIRRDFRLLQKLSDMGVYIQMNAGSISGEDGFLRKRFCKKVMQRNLLHFVGSDAHNPKNRKPNIRKCARYMKRIMGADYRDQIMEINPREIIEGSV